MAVEQLANQAAQPADVRVIAVRMPIVWMGVRSNGGCGVGMMMRAWAVIVRMRLVSLMVHSLAPAQIRYPCIRSAWAGVMRTLRRCRELDGAAGTTRMAISNFQAAPLKTPPARR
jgi:hypothetical protein